MGIIVFLILSVVAFSKDIVLDTFEEIKRFPFVTYKKVWTGTPAQAEDVTVPNVYIVIDKNESKEVFLNALQVAYFLGQWTEDMGITPKMIKEGKHPLIFSNLERALNSDKHIILIGINNELVKELGLKFEKPTLKVISYKGKEVLIVGGKDDRDVIKATRFLANRIISFKAGAYKTFFSFVELRGMIENEDFVSAINLIKDSSGLSACGKNMSLAAHMMAKFPPEVKKIVKKRNKIMYVELVKALEEKNKERARKLWKEAMFTCYQCHQGIGIKRIRKFVPNGEIHSKHQRIAMRYGLVKITDKGFDCSACHTGRTQIRGY